MTKKDAVKLVKSLGYQFDEISSTSDDLWFRPDAEYCLHSFVRVRNIRRSHVLTRAFDDAGVDLDNGSWLVEVNCHFIYYMNDLERTLL